MVSADSIQENKFLGWCLEDISIKKKEIINPIVAGECAFPKEFYLIWDVRVIEAIRVSERETVE